MANQRAKNKGYIGAYIDADLKERAAKILADKGLTLTDAIYEKIVEIIENEYKKTDHSHSKAEGDRQSQKKHRGKGA